VKAGSFDCNTSNHHHAKTYSGANHTQRQPEKACMHTHTDETKVVKCLMIYISKQNYCGVKYNPLQLFYIYCFNPFTF